MCGFLQIRKRWKQRKEILKHKGREYPGLGCRRTSLERPGHVTPPIVSWAEQSCINSFIFV